MNRTLLLGCFLSLITLNTHASDYDTYHSGIYYQNINVIESTSAIEGIGNGYSFGYEGNYRPIDYIEMTINLGSADFKDEDRFSQSVTNVDQFGNATGGAFDESSDILGLFWAIEAGPIVRVIDNTLDVFVKYGISGIDLDRSISNCDGCASEGINFESGNFVQLGAIWVFSRTELVLKYSSFDDTSDIETMWTLSWRGRHGFF
jgi:hypothetical protein